MAQQITINRFEKVGRIFTLFFGDGSSMEWKDQDVLELYIDEGPRQDIDFLVRGLLKRIRNADPTFANIGNISDVIYELPDVQEVI